MGSVAAASRVEHRAVDVQSLGWQPGHHGWSSTVKSFLPPMLSWTLLQIWQWGRGHFSQAQISNTTQHDQTTQMATTLYRSYITVLSTHHASTLLWARSSISPPAVPGMHTIFGDRSFAVTEMHLWNSMPAALWQMTSYRQFRQHLKAHWSQQKSNPQEKETAEKKTKSLRGHLARQCG